MRWTRACMVGVLILRAVTCGASEPAGDAKTVESGGEGRTARASFVIYAAPDDAELAKSMFRVLRGNDKVTRLAKAETIEDALTAPAEVLVLVIPGRTTLKLQKETLEVLRRRKIIGIGQGAARLFGQMGLQIHDGACVHGVRKPASVNVVPSELLGAPKTAEPIAVRRQPASDLEIKQVKELAMFVPSRGSDAEVVDVIARWSDDPNYAPIVHQGNCVLLGLPLETPLLAPAFQDLVNSVCIALRDRKLEPFSPARRRLTEPGVYQFQLGKSRSSDEPFEKSFYFRFADPRRITVRLEHAGSKSMMLLFMGEDDDSMHFTRRDAKNGEPLDVTAVIECEHIEQLADRHWTLHVTNFDPQATVSCKLTIAVEVP